MITSLFKKKQPPSDLEKKFQEQFYAFKKLDKNQHLKMEWDERFPCLNDNTETTAFDSHYIYHPAWAARIVKEINPAMHIDISSTLHFCSILSAFVPTEFYDFRPAKLNLDNLQTGEADLTNLHFSTNSIESLSCMHTIEHIGLGRYGDPLDPEGDLKAINELKRVVKVGGSLLLVVPVGEPRIMFNAHRIYDPETMVNYFEGFQLKEFSLVTDSSEFIKNASIAQGQNQQYGCGCFWFAKMSS